MLNGRMPNHLVANTPLARLTIGVTKADGSRIKVTLTRDPETTELVVTDWLTTEQAAKDMGVDRTHVARLVRDGRLDGAKLGSGWIIHRASVEEYLQTKAPSGRPAAHKPAEVAPHA